LENQIVDTILIGANFEHGIETGVLIVGRKMNGQQMDVINAFQGQEAMDIYNKLTTKKDDRVAK